MLLYYWFLLQPFNAECEEDCTGEWGGTTIEDCAGECAGAAVEDCAGECAGNAVEDCAGECAGNAILDDCGVCNNYSEIPGYPYGNCGCFIEEESDTFWCNTTAGVPCNQDNLINCNNECINDLIFVNPYTENNNGVYTNIGSTCDYWGCTDENANNYDSNATNCEDGSIGEDSSCCIYIQATLEFGALDADGIEILMTNAEPVAGFQFLLSGLTITGSAGGSAGENGFTVSTTTSSPIVLAFSFTGATIPVCDSEDVKICGLLTIIQASNITSSVCIEDVVITFLSGDNANISSNPVCFD